MHQMQRQHAQQQQQLAAPPPWAGDHAMHRSATAPSQFAAALPPPAP
eukprot:gene7553-1668_t